MSDAAIRDLAGKALLPIDPKAAEAKQSVDKQLARVVKDLEAITKELKRSSIAFKTSDILSQVRSIVSDGGQETMLPGATWKNDPANKPAGGQGKPTTSDPKGSKPIERPIFDPDA
ncbi:uncharacterized protein AB675_3783 [Cyphellophora attinorum]|uniref:Uncharacterized protein n=1 Tax=Cyphellophora attinorum TaxID=1664694 RepID=A0A0N1HLA8_9EURO|nr:uncharacterized protein AB675_3783 [Phialophora attinorum]KPI35260.1 hypothetical protein AB675_3783 [Phialophora attinorum]